MNTRLVIRSAPARRVGSSAGSDSEQGLGAVDLVDDFGGRELTAEAELGGRAEGTVERAADLRRDAERELGATGETAFGDLGSAAAAIGLAFGFGWRRQVVVEIGVGVWLVGRARLALGGVVARNEHRLDQPTVVSGQAQLAGAVARDLLQIDAQLGDGDGVRRRQLLAQLFGQVGHGLDVVDALAMDPAKNLHAAPPRQAARGRPRFGFTDGEIA